MKIALFIDTHGQNVCINPEHVVALIQYGDHGFVEIYTTAGGCWTVKGCVTDVTKRLAEARPI